MAELYQEYYYRMEFIKMMEPPLLETVISAEQRKARNRIPTILESRKIAVRTNGQEKCNYEDFLAACIAEAERRKES